MSRNKARVLAMQALFQLDKGGEGVHLVLDCGYEDEVYEDNDKAYLDHLVEEVIRNKERIDAYISKYSIDWDIGRLGKVERSILRLSIGEMLFIDDVPVSVSINEAVRMAKKYGADNASRFLNGILGKFVREELKDQVDEVK